MKIYKYILLVLSICTFSITFSQNERKSEREVKKVDKDYDNYAYIKTSEILLQVAENGYQSVDLFQKLGNSYYFNNDFTAAAKWYGKLMDLNKTVDPEYYFRYSQCLKALENYIEADKWMLKFNDTKPDDLRGKAFKSKIDYLSKIEEVSNYDIEVINLDINTSVSDFGTTQYKDQLIFASSRGKGKLYKWNEQPFLDLYSAKKQSDDSYSDVSKLDEGINTIYHESNAAFTPDDKYIFFTRNNYYKRKPKTDSLGVNKLKMFRAKLDENGDWKNITPVHFNSDHYSVAHPSINTQGTKLYFASDMPGTTGMSDIYVVDLNKDGTLGAPKNISSRINTEASESFPYINGNGDLFFSSNGYPGLGGLDIYVIRDFELKRASHNNNYQVENLGKPINSPKDDFSYYENLGTREGFFTSNRDGGKGDDDIYSFVVPRCLQVVEGIVTNKKTQDLLPNSTVTLLDASSNKIDEVVVGNDGVFLFTIDCDTEYLVHGAKETYTGDEKRFTTPNVKQELKLELQLTPDVQEIKKGDDLAYLLDIPIIHFDLDKSNIRYDAKIELLKIFSTLNQYPSMTIDIRSHTDSRAPDAYNERLSEKRAQSTRQHLISKGINAERITAKGYGESQLINKCSNGVKCSEKEHQANRRSEFIVVTN